MRGQKYKKSLHIPNVLSFFLFTSRSYPHYYFANTQRILIHFALFLIKTKASINIIPIFVEQFNRRYI